MGWKKKSYKPKGAAQQDSSATFPLLHQDVLNTLEDAINPEPWFNHDANEQDVINDYSTNIMGRFACRNPMCSSAGWGSKKIAIRIRGFEGSGYDAVVFKQRCRACEQLGAMRIDENSYVERVAYPAEEVGWDSPRDAREPAPEGSAARVGSV